MRNFNPIKGAIRKSFLWSLLVVFLSSSPLLISLFIGLISNEISLTYESIIYNGSILFVSLSIAGAAWVDMMFHDSIKHKVFKIVSNFIFVLLLLVVFSIYPLILSNSSIDFTILNSITIAMLILSYLFSVGLKSVMMAENDLFEAKKKDDDDARRLRNINKLKSLLNNSSQPEGLDQSNLLDEISEDLDQDLLENLIRQKEER